MPDGTASADERARRVDTANGRGDEGRIWIVPDEDVDRMNVACSECGGTMEPGYLADRGDGSMFVGGAVWVEGDLEMQKLLGLPVGVKMNDRARYDVVTLRCDRCGLLKSYAPRDSRRR